jgi:hypothetical protein
MAEAVYMLCALTSAGCAAALLRTYSRRRTPVLLWSSICFAGLAANNALLFVDLVVFPMVVDLSMLRAAIAAAATVTLVVGLIWNVE